MTIRAVGNYPMLYFGLPVEKNNKFSAVKKMLEVTTG